MKSFLGFFLFTLISPQLSFAQEPLYDRIFFANSPMKDSYYYSLTSYSSPSWIGNAANKLPVSDSIFFTPGNSLKLHYVSAAKGKWQAQVLFRPIRGQDYFVKPSRVTFRMFVSSATTSAELPSISLGEKDKSLTAALPLGNFVGQLRANEWMEVSIPLSNFKLSSSQVDKITAINFNQHGTNAKEHLLYIDQLELAGRTDSKVTAAPSELSAKGYEKHVDITWKPIQDSAVRYVKVYRSSDNKNFHPVGIQSPYISRYADYTDTTGKKFFYKISLLDHQYRESDLSAEASATTVPLNDQQLLDMVQEAHFRFYWEGAEKNSGLALENILGRRHMIATGASGFGMMALIAGVERGFITREQLVERFLVITSFLEKADKFHGAFPHFLDGTTGKVEPFFGDRDNGADLVETSFLMQGLLTAKQYFNGASDKEKLIVNRIEKLWSEVEWDWFRKDKNSKYLYWHWSPDQQWIINHKLIGWNETMITYFLAIASQSHGIPASFYYSGWASQDAEAQKYRSSWGQTKDGSLYRNGNTYYGIPLKVGVSNGGPLFFIHYSYLGLDPHELNDAYTNYFENNRHIALINYRYCVENPEKHEGYGADAWGLTASDGLWNYQADEPVPHQDHGKITPTGALASFPYTPDESWAALKNYYRNYGKFAWGEYGFYDAFNLDENWRSEIFMGLNQGPIVVMIENYRSGLLWKLFMQNEEVRNAITKIKESKPSNP